MGWYWGGLWGDLLVVGLAGELVVGLVGGLGERKGGIVANTKRVSGAVKGLRGSRVRGKKAEGVAGVPSMPVRYGKDKKYVAVWKELVERFSGLKVLTVGDGVALEMLTDSLVSYREVEEDIRKNGYKHITANGYEQIKPSVTMLNLRHKQLKGMLEQFGQTPASRSRAERTPGGEKDPLDAFLER